MTTWPGRHGAITDQYLRQLRLRPTSVRTYRPMLEQFQACVVAHSPEGHVSRQVFESWLHHRASFSSATTILQRVHPIDHFLEWLVNRQLINSNPLEDLRREFGTRNTAAIIRALLNSDGDKALEALRPAPGFASHLGPLMKSHVLLMRSLGFRYITQEMQLLRFDRFLQERLDLAGQAIPVLVQEWSKKNPVLQHRVECAEVERMVTKAIRRVDGTVAIPVLDQRLNQLLRRSQRRPHIYSEAQIHSLLTTARSFPSPEAAIRPLMLYTIFVLAYRMGLRIGEVVRLTIGDLNLDAQTVEIRETKFFKSRRLPFADSVARALQNYLEVRRTEGAPADSSAALFWCRSKERAYGYVTIRALLLQVIRKAGLKPLAGHVGPRIHDLRHSFVVNRILAWYREGADAQARLPYLATYLGHKDIHSTLV